MERHRSCGCPVCVHPPSRRHSNRRSSPSSHHSSRHSIPSNRRSTRRIPSSRRSSPSNRYNPNIRDNPHNIHGSPSSRRSKSVPIPA
jgi:hypothetical protein